MIARSMLHAANRKRECSRVESFMDLRRLSLVSCILPAGRREDALDTCGAAHVPGVSMAHSRTPDDEENHDVVAGHGDDVRVPVALAGQPWRRTATRQQAAKHGGDAKLRQTCEM